MSGVPFKLPANAKASVCKDFGTFSFKGSAAGAVGMGSAAIEVSASPAGGLFVLQFKYVFMSMLNYSSFWRLNFTSMINISTIPNDSED